MVGIIGFEPILRDVRSVFDFPVAEMPIKNAVTVAFESTSVVLQTTALPYKLCDVI
jgi:hypothetical protein